MLREITHNELQVFILESEHLSVELVPAMGGKISSIYNKKIDREFLWINQHLPFTPAEPGSEYDPAFLGGIDELFPNDVPEIIDAIAYPDHGELWTTGLKCIPQDNKLLCTATLSTSGIYYSKTVSLDEHTAAIHIDYLLRNDTNEKRHFLWKQHAALKINAGDKVVSPARYGLVADADYSRFKNEKAPFLWPRIENVDASVIPEVSNSMDFFYLYDIAKGTMQLHSADDQWVFAYDYDTNVFPYQWLFASYGGFMHHYTTVLEPCTNMPILVNEAIKQHQSAFLEAGASLNTRVRIYAGEKNNYLPL